MSTLSSKRKTFEGESFETSVIYWTGVLEEKFNAAFVERMQAGKVVISRWRTLSVLSEKGGLTIGELAHYTRIERSALSHLLQQMEKENLVVRTQASQDKRNIHVHLTKIGRETFLVMLPVRREILRQAARNIPGQQMAALRSTVQSLVEGLDALTSPAGISEWPTSSSSRMDAKS